MFLLFITIYISHVDINQVSWDCFFFLFQGSSYRKKEYSIDNTTLKQILFLLVREVVALPRTHSTPNA